LSAARALPGLMWPPRQEHAQRRHHRARWTRRATSLVLRSDHCNGRPRTL